jgi:hypothetical protein
MIERHRKVPSKDGRWWQRSFPGFISSEGSMELILIGKIGKFSHEKCKSVF